MKILLVSIPVLYLFACSTKKEIESDSYIAGFKIISAKDTSRIYKPNSRTTDYLHFRPLDIDVWYPAKSSDHDTVLLFRNIFGLLETRANYYTASTIGNGITSQITQFFCDRLKCSDSTTVLNYKTQSYNDAIPVNDKFPLVVYLTAFNGMSYENFAMFEELAKKGFVVVAISSNGRFPGNMTMKREDLMEQVNDAIASLNILRENPNIDFTKIGIIGYSWGGLSSTILASKLPSAKCLISFDGSEFHHYGKAKEENNDFDGIRYGQELKNMKINVPYLRLESSLSDDDTIKEEYDSVYNFTEKLSDQVNIFKIDSSRHEDFGCIPYIVRLSGNDCGSNQVYTTINKLSVSFLEEHLKNKKGFRNTVLQELGKTINRE